MAGQGANKPSRVDTIDPRGLPLAPLEGHVLSQIDGQSSVEDIAFILGHPVAQVEAAIARLEALGAVAVERVDLDPARQARLTSLFARLPRLNHYEVLGVGVHADKSELRAAYFALTKEVHPDTLFGRRLGRFRPMMEAIFRKATEAYEVLSARERRARYDETIGVSPLEAQRPPVVAETPAPPSSARPVARPSSPRPVPPPAERAPLARTEAERESARRQIASRLTSLSRTREGHPATAAPRRHSGVVPSVTPASSPIDHEAQARDEARRHAWAAATLSWAQVAAARPTYAVAYREAARCLLEARGDLRRARDLARRATELDTTDVHARITLARIFISAGMRESARSELAIAAKLDSKSEIVKNLLRELQD